MTNSPSSSSFFFVCIFFFKTGKTKINAQVLANFRCKLVREKSSVSSRGSTGQRSSIYFTCFQSLVLFRHESADGPKEPREKVPDSAFRVQTQVITCARFSRCFSVSSSSFSSSSSLPLRDGGNWIYSLLRSTYPATYYCRHHHHFTSWSLKASFFIWLVSDVPSPHDPIVTSIKPSATAADTDKMIKIRAPTGAAPWCPTHTYTQTRRQTDTTE